MNWLIQSDYNEHEELVQKNALSDYEKHRLAELESNIYFYEANYGIRR